MILILLIALIGGVFWYQNIKKENQEVHYHAGFIVYLDGKKHDFSALKYMHIEPCNEEENHQEDDHEEKAHLHDQIGDVVHVHRQGALWKDLFQNINFKFKDPASVNGYINGKEEKNILSKEIVPYESVIIIEGDIKNIDLNKYVSKSHMQEVEEKSESCGS